VRWNYVSVCLDYLSDLKRVLEEVKSSSTTAENALPPTSLSVNQEQQVSSMVQLVLALGVLPSLLPGVGTLKSQFLNVYFAEKLKCCA